MRLRRVLLPQNEAALLRKRHAHHGGRPEHPGDRGMLQHLWRLRLPAQDICAGHEVIPTVHTAHSRRSRLHRLLEQLICARRSEKLASATPRDSLTPHGTKTDSGHRQSQRPPLRGG